MTGHDIVVLGDVNMDYVVARSLTFPFSSLTENGLIYWEDIDEVPGGTGLNFCAFAAELGYRCLLLGMTGNDLAGSAIATWLSARRIAVPQHWTTTAPTGKAMILRDSAGIRLVINNRQNANHELTVAHVEKSREALASCQLAYVSGYCISELGAARHNAALRAMALAKEGARPAAVVFDVVPHRIYEHFSFEKFRECTRDVDILISEVATVRRFLGLGSVSETIDEDMARDTAERITAYYPRVILRYGPSGCDHEVLADALAGALVHQATGHSQAADKRGYGDRLALKALRQFFHLLPLPDVADQPG